MVIPHPIVGLMPGCPLEHLLDYGSSADTCRMLEQWFGEAGTVGDLTRYMESCGFTSIWGIGPKRAIELERVLTTGGVRILRM